MDDNFFKNHWGKIALAVLAVFAIIGYNDLVGLDAGVSASFSQIQNQEKRRNDAIPNLVETVKGLAKQELDVFTKVTEARAKVGQVVLQVDPSKTPTPEEFQKMQAAQSQLNQALKSILAVSERYPELKSDKGFLALQAQIEGSENRIAVARGDFIKATQYYNAAIRKFPRVIYAGALGFKEKPQFSATPEERQVPKVDFNTKKS